MRFRLFIAVGVAILISVYSHGGDKGIRVEIKGDWFYVNGERFLVKGVAYSPWRPGELPWDVRPNLERMEEDLKRIKEAGFNTIRTWAPLKEEELLLAKEYDLMVIQGIWIDPIADPLRSYIDTNLINRVKEIVSKEVKRFKDYDNILMFLVGNEMPVEGIMKSGVENTEKMLKEIKDTVKIVDPTRHVSFASWAQLSFVDHSFWDSICFNVYSYFPVTISHSLDFSGYIGWLKERFSRQKPLIITEYGLSVSKMGDGRWGYGGNSEEEQREGCVFLWDSLIQTGATGGCIFEWNDEWWKNYEIKGDEDIHNDEPEEWFGILGIEGVKENYTERLRPVYSAMKEYNQAIIVEPKRYKFYDKSIPIEIYTTGDVYGIKYKIDDSEWVGLKQSNPHWWVAEQMGSDREIKSHILEIEAIDKDGRVACKKQMEFWSGYKKGPGYNIDIICEDKYTCGKEKELISVVFKVLDENNRPVKGIPVEYSFYETRFWSDVSGQKVTNEEGLVRIDYYIREPGYIIVAAGVDYIYGNYKNRCGNIRFIEVVKG